MKLKKVFILTVLLGLMFSCIAEDPIENPNLPAGETSRIDITLSMGDLITKAGAPADNYTYATDAEITVSDCVFAIFTTAGDRVFYKKASVGAKEPADRLTEKTTLNEADKSVLAYGLSDVAVPLGTGMTVIVIANSKENYSDCTDLGKFKAKIETTGTSTNPTFNPTELVKVGILEMDITTATTEIKVPMVQLAARVDLNLAITAKDGLDLNEGVLEFSYEFAGFIDEMTRRAREDGNFMKNSGIEIGDFKIGVKQNEDKSRFSGKSYVFYPGHNSVTVPSSAANVKLSPGAGSAADQWLVQRVDSRKTQWAIDLKSITIDNILLKSDVILDKWGTLIFSNKQQPKEENLGSLTWENPKEGEPGHIDRFAGRTFILTFYTYEKEFDKEPLKITVDADVIPTTISSVQRYGGLYGYWYDLSTQTLQNSPAGANVVFVIIPESEFTPIGNVQEVVETKGEPIGKRFAFIINPHTPMEDYPQYKSNTDGVIHGNLYSVEATVKNVSIDVNVDLEYAVVGWNTPKEIDIPAFE